MNTKEIVEEVKKLRKEMDLLYDIITEKLGLSLEDKKEDEKTKIRTALP